MIFQFLICILATLTTILLLIFAIFAFAQRKNLSNLLLSLFLLSNALFLIDYVGVIIQMLLEVSIPGIGSIGLAFGYLFGPLLYLFTRSITTKDFGFRKIYYLHLIPFVISAFILLSQIPLSYSIHFIVLILQIFIYLFMCGMAIRKYMTHWEMSDSVEFQTNLNWLGYVIGGFVVMWAVDFAGFVLHQLDLTNSTITAIATLLSITINFTFAIVIFYMALKQPKFLYKLGEDIKYKNSRLTESGKGELAQKIQSYFKTERPYLNPGLSLKDVSIAMDAPSKYISQVINESLAKNFYDLVNNYRIDEAKKQLLENREKTVLEILYNSGFNTKSAFNTAFKKHTGKTPSEFRNSKINRD